MSSIVTNAIDGHLREIIENPKERLAELNTNSSFGMIDYKAVPQEWRAKIPE